jgi:hypothetical protein
MTKFKEYDVVRLTRPIPEHGLAAEAQGAVLMVFPDSQPICYELEFLDPAGNTIALVTLPEDALRKDQDSATR